MSGRADILVLGEDSCARTNTVKTSAGMNRFSRDEENSWDVELAVILELSATLDVCDHGELATEQILDIPGALRGWRPGRAFVNLTTGWVA